MTRRQFREQVILYMYQYDLMGEKRPHDILKIEEKFDEVVKYLAEIDRVISRNLRNYTIDRLSFMDRSIIRYAVYEMLYTDTPKKIIINEAIEITKKYTDLDEKQRSFTNRVLDNIKKEIGD